MRGDLAAARGALAAALAGGAAAAALAALQARPPGGAARWRRTNHAGHPITLLEGPAYAAGAAVAVAVVPGLPARLRAAGVLATAGAAGFGAVDDLFESGTHKGLRGHLGELARGRLSTGGLKVLGIGVTGLVAAVLARPDDAHPGVAALVDAGVDAGLVAGGANLANLLDLRPGRVLKVVLLLAPFAASRRPAAALVGAAGGAAVALLPGDLGARSMLGDTGANAAGALLGVAAVHGLRRRGRLGLLAAITGLTLASEKVSFTRVIERTPVLREFDRLGRG